MNFDISSIPASTAGIFGAVVLSIIGLVGRIMSSRKETSDKLRAMIDETEKALSLALENGMVTDAKRLAKRLESLREKLGKRSARAFCASSRLLSAVLAMTLASGCGSMRGASNVEYIVVGERINIVEPGQVLTVPELVPPATKWYLVDNVGLEGWLGIGDR